MSFLDRFVRYVSKKVCRSNQVKRVLVAEFSKQKTQRSYQDFSTQHEEQQNENQYQAGALSQTISSPTMAILKLITQQKVMMITNYPHNKESEDDLLYPNEQAKLHRSASLLLSTSPSVEEVDWSTGVDAEVAPSLIVSKTSDKFKDNAFLAQSPLFSNLITIHEKQHKWELTTEVPEWRESSRKEFERMFPLNQTSGDLVFDTMSYMDAPKYQKFTTLKSWKQKKPSNYPQVPTRNL